MIKFLRKIPTRRYSTSMVLTRCSIRARALSGDYGHRKSLLRKDAHPRGVVQITERDESFYHEMLAHVVLHAHPHPRKRGGDRGGDGGAVREV